jgi:PKD repeat protein
VLFRSLTENKLIGMSWAVKDYDDATSATSEPRAFWNLSTSVMMYGDASHLVQFRLMPIEPKLRKPVEAQFSLKIVDQDQRLVAFKDLSYGKITSWKWDFGDGSSSAEQHPVHTYAKGGEYIVTLSVEGPEGTARKAKVWDVVLK